MRIKLLRGVLTAAALTLLTSGCGKLTVRTWATIVGGDSSGSVDAALFSQPLPINRLQGGFLTSIALHTNDLDGILNGEIALEDVRMAGDITTIGAMCVWNDPTGFSGGSLAVDLLSQQSVTDVFLDAKATTNLNELLGLGSVDFEQPVDFDLGGGLDPAGFVGALGTGSSAGLFESQTQLANATTLLGVSATFSVDVAITNGPLPPSFDPDLLDFCTPFFAQQGTDLFYGINPKSSYLIRNGSDAVRNPLVISLDELGAQPGDTLHLKTVGSYDWLTTLRDGGITKLGGVFSATNEVLPASGNLNRVVAAVDAGPDLQTWPTQLCGWLGCLHLFGGNDIAEDFRIDPARDIVVPPGAHFLVVAPIDDWKTWGDNSGLGFGLTIAVN